MLGGALRVVKVAWLGWLIEAGWLQWLSLGPFKVSGQLFFR